MDGRGREFAALGATLLVLAGVVALASRAQVSGGGGGWSVDTVALRKYALLLTGVALLVTVPVAVYAVVGALREGQLPSRSRSGWVRSLLLVVVTAAAFVVAVEVMRTALGSEGGRPPLVDPSKATQPVEPKPGELAPFDWVPVAVVGSLTVTGALAAAVLLYHRRVPRKRLGDPARRAVAAALDESLDKLIAELDPREAVIAAYARMERALAGAGLPRRLPEAPQEYLERVLSELGAWAASVERLTALYEQALFSVHRIHAGMKDEAIGALTALRDELRDGR